MEHIKKHTRKHHYRRELLILNELDKIDPDHEFHLKHRHNDAVMTITFPRFGQDINNSMSHMHVRKFLHVFKTIGLMHQHDIYHCDIKPDNILYDNGSFRVIDFDRSIKVNRDEYFYYCTIYTDWPVESILLGYDSISLKEFKTLFCRYRQKAKNIKHQGLIADPNHIVMKDIEKMYGVLTGMTRHKLFNLFFQKLDTWCLGYTLSRILNCQGHQGWNNAALNNLCIDMCHKDIEKRITIAEATERFDKITRTSKRNMNDFSSPNKKSK